MKEVGSTAWQGSNSLANNSSGFTALPCGFLHIPGSIPPFGELAETGILWSINVGTGGNSSFGIDNYIKKDGAYVADFFTTK